MVPNFISLLIDQMRGTSHESQTAWVGCLDRRTNQSCPHRWTHQSCYNLPTLRSSQQADNREPKEKDDESIPDVEEPMDPIDPPPHEPSSSRKRPSWLKGLLDDAEGHVAPWATFRESKKPNRYQGYLTIMSTIIQNEPSSFSDAVKHQVWKDAMTEEYESIMKNDVWEVVPRP